MSDVAFLQSSRRTGVMRYLVWKDFRLVRSLVIGATIGVFGLFGLMVLLIISYERNFPGECIALWLTLPSLVALGLPPMLIGTENETRSLDWLHGLPVSWRNVLLSKLLVSVAVWLGTLVVATIFLVAINGFFPDSFYPVPKIQFDTFTVLWNIVFGGVLLLVGMMWSLLVRNPLVGTILVFPSMILVTSMFAMIDRRLHVQRASLLSASPEQRNAAIVLLACLIGTFLIGLGSLVVVLGRRRLSGYSDEPWWNVWKSVHSISPRASRSSLAMPLLTTEDPPNIDDSGVAWWPNPTAWSALLWQQWVQIRWPWAISLVLGLFGVVFCLFSLSSGGRTQTIGMEGLLLWISQWVLGTLCFYGDRRKSRMGFFANLGISPTQVWCSRVLPCGVVSVTFTLLMASMLWLIRSSFDPNYRLGVWIGAVAGQVLAFAVGMAAGQWTARSTLSFFIAPILMYLYCMLLFLVMIPYVEYAQWIWVAIPFWWFATWRLTRMWMESGRGLAIWARGLGYAALGLLCVTTGVYAHRFADIPEQLTEWQSQMRSMTWSESTPANLPQVSEGLTLFGASGSRSRDLDKGLRDELADDLSIGRLLTRAELVEAMRSPQTAQLAVEVALKWANVVRQRVMAGKSGLRELQGIAEWSENLAVEKLLETVVRPGTDDLDLNQLVPLFANDDLRNESRRLAIIAAWQEFESAPWFHEQNGIEKYKEFAGRPFESTQLKTAIERLRAERLIDEAVHETLDDLATGLPLKNSPGFLAAQRRWERPFQVQELPSDQSLFAKQLKSNERDSSIMPVFTSDLQTRIDRLRAATK